MADQGRAGNVLTRQVPCNAIVWRSVSEFRRCGLAWDDEMHDPLGPVGCHVYDNVPLLDGDDSGAVIPADGDDGESEQVGPESS